MACRRAVRISVSSIHAWRRSCQQVHVGRGGASRFGLRGELSRAPASGHKGLPQSPAKAALGRPAEAWSAGGACA
eukprot:9470544-Pyramimonas_sp.AAC.2